MNNQNDNNNNINIIYEFNVPSEQKINIEDNSDGFMSGLVNVINEINVFDVLNNNDIDTTIENDIDTNNIISVIGNNILSSIEDYLLESVLNISFEEEKGMLRDENVSIEIKKEKFKDNVSGECCICCSKYMKNEEYIKLECGHLFHSGCIEEWVKYKKNCPVCRIKI
jgi:hypothetical protein